MTRADADGGAACAAGGPGGRSTSARRSARCAGARATRRSGTTAPGAAAVCGAPPARRRARPRLRLAVGRPTARSSARAWGPGAAWVLDGLPDLLGADDDPAGFAPDAPGAARHLARRHGAGGCRGPAGCWRRWCRRCWSRRSPAARPGAPGAALVRRYGEPAPGPVGAVPAACGSPPDAATWARVPSWDWHRAGVDLARSRTVVTAAGRAGRLEELVALPPAEAADRLRTLPGIGVWTAAEVAPARARRRGRGVGRRLPPARRWSAGRWSASRSTTTGCSSCSSPTAATATGCCG